MGLRLEGLELRFPFGRVGWWFDFWLEAQAELGRKVGVPKGELGDEDNWG